LIDFALFNAILFLCMCTLEFELYLDSITVPQDIVCEVLGDVVSDGWTWSYQCCTAYWWNSIKV